MFPASGGEHNRKFSDGPPRQSVRKSGISCLRSAWDTIFCFTPVNHYMLSSPPPAGKTTGGFRTLSRGSRLLCFHRSPGGRTNASLRKIQKEQPFGCSFRDNFLECSFWSISEGNWLQKHGNFLSQQYRISPSPYREHKEETGRLYGKSGRVCRLKLVPANLCVSIIAYPGAVVNS